eukprot:1175088-Prymnesium_polylepis.1
MPRTRPVPSFGRPCVPSFALFESTAGVNPSRHSTARRRELWIRSLRSVGTSTHRCPWSRGLRGTASPPRAEDPRGADGAANTTDAGRM